MPLNRDELMEVLVQHEKRGLPGVNVKTEDLRELMTLAFAPVAPEPTTYTGYDAAAIAACIRQWPFPMPVSD